MRNQLHCNITQEKSWMMLFLEMKFSVCFGCVYSTY